MAHNFVHLPNDQMPPRHETHERIFPQSGPNLCSYKLDPSNLATKHKRWQPQGIISEDFSTPAQGLMQLKSLLQSAAVAMANQENSGVYLRLPTLSEKVPKSAGCWHLNISHLRSEIVFQEISWRLAVIPLHLSCFRIFNKSFRQSSINVKPRSCVCSCSV